jgi:hypothetical protein
LRVSASPLPISFEVLFPKVTDQAPCILSYRTIMIYFGSSGLQDLLDSPLPISSEVLWPEITDQASRVPPDQMINIYFRNPDFGSFISSRIAFIQSIFSRRPQIVATCPSKSNGGSFLRDSGLREFQLPRSRFHPECFLPDLTDPCHVSSSNRRSLFTSEL